MRSIFVAGLCLLLVAGMAFSQSARGTITGTISDSAGAVIPNASIQAKNTETGATYNVASTLTGNYTFAQLPAGVYQLSTSVPGFKQYLRTGITVLVAQTLRIDIRLDVGEISETVTVNADAPLLKTESGELSHNITSEKIGDLPILGFAPTIRDPLAVTALIPGAAYATRGYVRVNGAPNNSNSIRVEGQDANNGVLLNSTSINQQSVEAIEEVAIQTSNYSAEYGQSGGGFLNVTMKSGTNSFHGSAYDYFSNEALNANQPFVNNKERVRRNNWGFNIGGPVLIPNVYDGRDKAFFFFNFEQYRETSIYTTSYKTVPTLAYRQGDFRRAMPSNPKVLGQDPLGRDIIEGTIYDPATDRVAPNGQRVRDPFPDNMILPERFDPVAVKIQEMIPLPMGATQNSLIRNYLNPWESPNIRTVPSVKADYNLSNNSKLSFFWSRTTTYNPNSVFFADGFPSDITRARNTNVSAHTARLSFDHTLSPTMLFHLAGGVQTMKMTDFTFNKDFNQLKELGLPGANTTIFPRIAGLYTGLGGFDAGGMGPDPQSDFRMLKTTANASFTWVKSNHTYKFGAEMRLEGYPVALLTPANGIYNFGYAQTALAIEGLDLQGRTIGFPYASFLLGLVNDGNIGVVSNPKQGKSAWGLFAQDSWKVTRKLTLDYGLRWDYQGYMHESHGRVANFSPTTPNPSAGGLPGAVIFEGSGSGHCNCDFARVYPYAFGPRLGLAYQIRPKTVLRAGWGITYAQTASENRTSTAFGSSNPYQAASYGDPAVILSNGSPTPGPWPNLDPGQYPFLGVPSTVPIAIDHNAGRPGRQIQWSFGIQQEISQNLSLEVSYVGNRGAWWQANSLIDVNALTPERIASFGLDINDPDDQALLKSSLDSPLAAQRGFDKPPYASFPMKSTVAQSLRPFPQFVTINYRYAPLGRTWYDGLQMKLTKRFSHGLDFTSAFTWQKELVMGGEDAISATAPVNDVFNRPMNKYISGYSRPVVWTTAINYTLPALDTNRFLSWAIRDWTIGAVLEYASGMPILAPTAQNQLSSLLFRDTFANRVPGEPLWTVDINDKGSYDPFSDFVLNPDAWVDPPAGQFGNSAAYYSDYRRMRRPTEAMSIGRIFRLKEGISLSFRADFQNIFNRLVFDNPSSTNAKARQIVNPTTGETTTGFGDINTANTRALAPRNGIIVARIQF